MIVSQKCQAQPISVLCKTKQALQQGNNARNKVFICANAIFYKVGNTSFSAVALQY